MLVGKVDQEIELRRGHFEVVAKTHVPLPEESSERIEIAGLERRRNQADAIVLTDDVA